MLEALVTSGFWRRNQRGRGPAFVGPAASPEAVAAGAAIVVVDALGAALALVVAEVAAGVGVAFDFDLHATIAIASVVAQDSAWSLRIGQSYQYVPSSGRPRVSKAQ